MSRIRRAQSNKPLADDPALCTQRYFTPRPKAGFQAKECGTSKINPASDLTGALAVCDDRRAAVLEFFNIL